MSGWEIGLNMAKEFLGQNKPEEAMAILNKLADENSSKVLFMKGEIYFKLQKWGEALNQFSMFLEQFPADKKAESYCIMIRDILGFYHKDLYNP